MRDDIVQTFWGKWEKAIDKAEHIRKLGIIDRPDYINSNHENDAFIKHSFATILNSYFEDLYEYMISKYKIEVEDEQD
jgi:hypothetical protein